MNPKQKILALVMAVGLLMFIIETVRRRKLREEYAWLWVLIGVIILVLSLWEGSLRAITGFLGIELPVNTVFFFGLMFVVFINLHFSVKISQLTNQVKLLTQELAIKKNEHRTSNVQLRTSNVASPEHKQPGPCNGDNLNQERKFPDQSHRGGGRNK